nr:MAG TPA: hypothetical protein [Caudoviricetes sp.]
MKKFLRRAVKRIRERTVEGVRKWALKKLVGDCRIITDVYEGYVLETFENSNTEAVVWDFSLFDSMGIIGKKVYGDFSEENIRKVIKEENYQETEVILDRIKKIMSKPMIYYGIVARYNDGSHEILQQDLVDYYRGKEEEGEGEEK